jgi:cardiolipin synthase
MAVNAGRFKLGLVLFVIQGVSDMLDGFLARLLGKKTALGAFLDPIADKAMLVSSYIVLCLHGIVPVWVTAVVLIRDIIVPGGYLLLYKLSYKIHMSPSLLGKITTTCQICTVVYILWSDTRTYQDSFFYATALVTVLSGIQYITRGFRVLVNKHRACL